mmetsp:Transcript_120590/g.348494  ORF Transcript_120590/g.348494 Transcript_120590/m.348494 type:complete len:242 (+) Transcript_120590:88-813(+)
MSGRPGYSAKFLSNTNHDGHTAYTIRVVNPEGAVWTIVRRYREINELHETLRLHHETLPRMPSKRLWGNQDPAFIRRRQHELQEYFEGVLRVDPDMATPALKSFLEPPPPPPPAERNTSRAYIQIFDKMQARLLNLAVPPAALDEAEYATRMQKYSHAMRVTVLGQPLDPLLMEQATFDQEPPPFTPCSTEHLEALKEPTTIQDGNLLSDLLEGLQEVLHQEEPIADEKKLIVPFPATSYS